MVQARLPQALEGVERLPLVRTVTAYLAIFALLVALTNVLDVAMMLHASCP
jgi:hypothetical protein